MMRLKKIRGSALLETTLAMVIVSICLTLSYSYITNLVSGDSYGMKARARLAVHSLLHTDNTTYLELEGISIERSVRPYAHSEHILQVEFTVYDANGDIIQTSKHLIDKNEEN